jgi:acylphosphatase
MNRVRINVAGIVQGVYFRHHTQIRAFELGLKGWVRNLADGSVEVVCQGERDKIDRMIEWCRTGPRGALVERTEVSWEKCTGEIKTFEITY